MKLQHSFAFLASGALLFLAACGSSTIGGGSGAGGTGTNTGGTNTGGTNIGGTGTGGAGTCSDLESPNKACNVDADCAVFLHQIDCCGSQAAIGVAASAVATYVALEPQCVMGPICDCVPFATLADDGQGAPDFGSPIPVACQAGQCMTYIPNGLLCNGVPNPESCAGQGCPAGYDCVPDTDPNVCHSSVCACQSEGWTCTADCGFGGSTCLPSGATCKGEPSPVSCTATSCPAGYACVKDSDPNTCHPSTCACDSNGWACTDDCGFGGSTCLPTP